MGTGALAEHLGRQRGRIEQGCLHVHSWFGRFQQLAHRGIPRDGHGSRGVAALLQGPRARHG